MNNYPKITDRKIRIGIVGCGRISKNHFGSIEKHADEMELIAICDIDPVTWPNMRKSTMFRLIAPWKKCSKKSNLIW